MALDNTVQQQQEFEALQAIYGQDFQTRPGIWNRPACAIRVHPLGEADSLSEITLVIKLAASYPSTAPSFQLIGRRGVTQNDEAELLDILKEKATILVGEVMIYELVLAVEEFLDERGEKPAISAYEQMKLREEEQLRQRAEAENIEAEAARLEEEEKALEAAKNRQAYERTMAEELARRKERVRSEKEMLHDTREETDWEDADEIDGYESDEEEDNVVAMLPGSSTRSAYSRYEKDFKELGVLGRGSSGQVVLAKNRLDRRLYAVKKIKLDEKDPEVNRRLRREVTTISRLIQSNIVRYYQAWYETVFEAGGEGEGNSLITKSSGLEEEEGMKDRALDTTAPSAAAFFPPAEQEELSTSSTSSIARGQPESSASSEGVSDSDQEEEENGDACQVAQPPGLWATNYAANGGGVRIKHRSSPLVMFGSGEVAETYEGEMSEGMSDDLQDRRRRGRRRSEDEEAEAHGDSVGGLMELLNPVPLRPDSELSWSLSAGYTRAPGTSAANDKGQSAKFAESGSPDAGASRQKSCLGQRPTRTSLYIQMEYCSSTLRELIDSGRLHANMSEVWRLFRQMLEALAYIHKRGIIHRDLKPSNIFQDRERNIKLGDFGLATVRLSSSRGRPAAEQAKGLMSPPSPSGTAFSPRSANSELPLPKGDDVARLRNSESDSITGGIGTLLYTAPEQAAVNSPYNQKADMFSLGIVLFEMAHPPFKTSMERVRAIQALRQQQFLPTASVANTSQALQRVILQLVSPEIEDRPSAATLLMSSDLPAKFEVEEVYLKEALTTLTNRQSASFSRLIQAFFARTNPPEVDALYDMDWIRDSSKLTFRRVVSREAICSYLQHTFSRHGALPLSTPLFRPKPAPANGNSSDAGCTGLFENAPEYLDMDGSVLRLPQDLLLPLARYVAHAEVSHAKAYEIGKTFRRRDTASGGHPREEQVAQLAFICDVRHATGGEIFEAEALWIAGQIATSALGLPHMLRLNSVHLTVGTLELFNIPAEARRPVVGLLAKVCSGTITEVKRLHHLVDGLPESSGKSLRAPLRGLCMRLWDAGSDPFARLHALEDTLSTLPQVKAALGPPPQPVGTTRRSSLSHGSRRELKRVRQACKSVSEAMQSMRTLLHYLHALGLLPASTQSDTPLRGDFAADILSGSSATEPVSLHEAAANLQDKGCVKPLDVPHAPARVSLDLGLYRRRSHYSSGLIFQIVALPSSEDSDCAWTRNAVQGSQAAEYKDAGDKTHECQLPLQQFCVAEGGRFDNLVLAQRSPAQWALPSMIAVGLTVEVEKLACMAAQLYASGRLPAQQVLDCASTGSGSLDVLICSAGSGLGPSGMTDRLLVASYLWVEGIRADYVIQDMWISNGPANFEASIEDISRMCLSLGIPFLVIIKAHFLRDKQLVKLRCVWDTSASDATISLSDLARTIAEKLPRACNGLVLHQHLPQRLSLHIKTDLAGLAGLSFDTGRSTMLAYGQCQHVAGYQSSFSGIEIAVKWPDRSVHVSGPERRKAHKEIVALERRIQSLLETLVGHTSIQKVAVEVLVLDLPYMIIRSFSTSYLRYANTEEALKELLNGPGQSQHKRSLRLLAESLEAAAEKMSAKAKENSNLVVYSTVDDAVDVIPLRLVGVGIAPSSSSSGTGKREGRSSGLGRKR